jgi:Fe-S-cluster-containing dehydrogenase component
MEQFPTSRRNFLKGCLAGGAAVATASVPETAAARDTLSRPAEALGLLYDATRCVGCQACVAACKQVNENPAEFNAMDKLWDTPLDTSGHTFNLIKMYRNGTMETKDSELNGFAFMKTSCMHCADPSCVSACPVSAMTKNPLTGVVGYDADACIGCRYCVAACPFGIPKYQYDSPTGKIGKCELCRHRHDDGHYSACAEVCPTGATLFGRTEDLLAEANRRLALKPGEWSRMPRGRLPAKDESAADAAKWKGLLDQGYEAQVGNYLQHVYGEKEYGGTQVLKLSAVNFQKVGLPDLPPKSSAATSETIQHSLYGGMIMPFAVLAGLTWIARRNVVAGDPVDDKTSKGDK